MPISSLRRAAAAAAVVAAGATATLLGSPASAQTTCYPPTANCVTTTIPPALTLGPVLTLSATTVTRGQTIVASVTGLRPGSRGIFSVASVEQQLATFVVSDAGTASANITIPTNISLGAHTVFARGTAPNGTSASPSRAITVVSAVTGGGAGGAGGGGRSLARTGAVVVPSALVGLGLVAGGAALKRSSKRSKSSLAS